MGPLEQAKSELIRQFETLVTTDQQSAIARLQTKMKLGVDLLAWMKGQLVYPQFYLRFRDEDKTVAAVGKVRSFSDVNLAQQFIQEHDFPLVGGLQFQGESQFILPQVLIEQQHGETCLLYTSNYPCFWLRSTFQLFNTRTTTRRYYSYFH